MAKKSSAKTPARIYVIAAKDSSMADLRCDQLLDELIPADQRAMSLFAPDADKIELSEVLDELRTLPFLAEKRVVLLKNADKFISNNRESLEKYFESPSPTGILVITVSSWRSTTKLAKKLPAVGTLINISAPKAGQLPSMLIEYAADKCKKKLTFPAARLLVDFIGDELPALYNEVEKLSLYIDTENTITPQHVGSLAGHNRLFNAFGVIDAMMKKQPALAVDRLRSMFAADRSAEYTVVGAFAFQLRKMFNARALLDNGINQAQVASKLGIWYNKDAFFAQLRRMSLPRLGSLICALADIDYHIKTGRTTAKSAVERLVLNLAAK